MKIDGKAIADGILKYLAQEIALLKEKGTTPTLAVILIGDNPASAAYINQKQKAAERIGAKIVLRKESLEIRKEKLQKIIEEYNSDPNIHGLIVQRPLPPNLSHILIYEKIREQKDVDGFEENSPFPVPVVLAVETILKSTGIDYVDKRIVVIGRGETAGKPIAQYFKTASVVHSQTLNPKEIIRQADIVISCVGKERVVTKDIIKPGAVLIGVGIWRDSEGKLRGDYNESEIESVARYYTPTPGGVGPVNVACLMQNLVKACTMTI